MKVYRVTQPMTQDGHRLGTVSFWTQNEARAKAHAALLAERQVATYDVRDPAVPEAVRREAIRAAGEP